MADKFVNLKVDQRSVEEIQQMLNRLLASSRKQGPKVVKELVRKVGYQVAKYQGPDVKGAYAPKMARKFRPLKKVRDIYPGYKMYVVNKGTESKQNKKGSKRKGFSGIGADSTRRRIQGPNGEIVILTKKKIAKADERFSKLLPSMIEVWSKKKKGNVYVPSMKTGAARYDQGNAKFGKIPRPYLAKQAWMWTMRGIVNATLKGSSYARKFSSNINRLNNKDKPFVRLTNSVDYAVKLGGNKAAKIAILQAMKSFNESLKTQAQRAMIRAAKRG